MTSEPSARGPHARPRPKAPRRLSTTLPYRTYEELENRSTKEGRSLSNLAAYLIEIGLFES